MGKANRGGGLCVKSWGSLVILGADHMLILGIRSLVLCQRPQVDHT